VALVPHSSPISKSGLLFFNTLFDENAACHIALGSAIRMLRRWRQARPMRLPRGAATRVSSTSIWMIGSNKIDTDGIRADGSPHAGVPQRRMGVKPRSAARRTVPGRNAGNDGAV